MTIMLSGRGCGGYWKQTSRLILPGFGKKKGKEMELDAEEMVELEE